MEKLEMQTSNLANENFEKLKALFPNAITETIDEEGNIVRAIDKDILSQEISTQVVEGREERYQFTWPDKRKAILSSNAPTSNTLRPCREESVNFDETENLYIEGDNLDILKQLQEAYLGKIDLIYADPPYNTGTDMLYFNNFEMDNEEFKFLNSEIDDDGNIMKYNTGVDGRIHTNWLNMMYPRIKLARNLLKNDGCFVLSIDHNELSNSVKMCDEIFGESNRIGLITVVHKPEGRNQEKYFASSNEFALFYAKNRDEFELEPIIIDEDMLKSFNLKDSKGLYKLRSYISKNHGRQGFDKNLRENSPHKFYSIYVSPDGKEVTLDKKDGYYEALPITTNQERTWKHIKETFKEKLKEGEIVGEVVDGNAKIYEKYRAEKGQLIKTHWIDKRYNAMINGTKYLDNIMGAKTFDFPKSIYFIEDVIRLTTKDNSTVLDLFSGSSTTAHAIFNLNKNFISNRNFILLQLNEEINESEPAFKAGYRYIPEIGKERIRRAGKKIIEDNQDKEGIDNLDIGFRVLKTDSSNMKDVFYAPAQTEQSLLDMLSDNIKEDRSSEDLLFQVMLDLGISLSSKIDREIIDGKEVLIIEDGFLVACFDKDISDEIVKTIANKKPYYAVFRDSSMANDSVATNFEQIFENISPQTVRKAI